MTARIRFSRGGELFSLTGVASSQSRIRLGTWDNWSVTRTAECTVCGTPVEAGKRGPLPKYCGRCRYGRQIEASQRWKARNPDHVKAYRDEYYADPVHREDSKTRNRKNYAANPVAAAVARRKRYVERQQATIAATVRAYRLRNPGKHAEIENRRRARKLAQFVAPVDPVTIRDRDKGLCGICGHAVASDEQSLDHIVPLARGGTHEPANVQLAHRSCNSRKGAKLLPIRLPREG